MEFLKVLSVENDFFEKKVLSVCPSVRNRERFVPSHCPGPVAYPRK